MATPEEQREYLLKQLQRKPQMSWDWEADEDFAQFIGRGDVACEIRHAIDSASVLAIRVAYFEMCGGKTNRLRLRRLRELTASGKVVAFWVGLGAGGYGEFGVRRVRGWEIAKSVNS